MFRTVVNVTGDVVVTAVVAAKEGELSEGLPTDSAPAEEK
jgi:Na+/H+-dicarboxylate symporter